MVRDGLLATGKFHCAICYGNVAHCLSSVALRVTTSLEMTASATGEVLVCATPSLDGAHAAPHHDARNHKKVRHTWTGCIRILGDLKGEWWKRLRADQF